MEKQKFNQINYINDFNKKHYKRFTLSIPLNQVKAIEQLENEKNNKTMNKYVVNLINEDIERKNKKNY